MKKAGLTFEQRDILLAEDETKGTNRYHTDFYEQVVKHIDDIPRPPLVKVEGIDAILDSIPIIN